MSLRNRTVGRRGRQNTCVWQGYYMCVLSWSSLNTNVFWSFTKRCFKESEVWRKVVSNKIFVILVTQGLPCSLLSRAVGRVHECLNEHDYFWFCKSTRTILTIQGKSKLNKTDAIEDFLQMIFKIIIQNLQTSNSSVSHSNNKRQHQKTYGVGYSMTKTRDTDVILSPSFPQRPFQFNT